MIGAPHPTSPHPAPPDPVPCLLQEASIQCYSCVLLDPDALTCCFLPLGALPPRRLLSICYRRQLLSTQADYFRLPLCRSAVTPQVSAVAVLASAAGQEVRRLGQEEAMPVEQRLAKDMNDEVGRWHGREGT